MRVTRSYWTKGFLLNFFMKTKSLVFTITAIAAFIGLVFGENVLFDSAVSMFVSERIIGMSLGWSLMAHLLGLVLLSLWTGWVVSGFFGNKKKVAQSEKPTEQKRNRAQSVKLYGKNLKPKHLLIAAIILTIVSFVKFDVLTENRFIFVNFLSANRTETVFYENLTELDVFAEFSMRQSHRRRSSGYDYCEAITFVDIPTNSGQKRIMIPMSMLTEFGITIQKKQIPVRVSYLDACQNAVQSRPKKALLESAFGIRLD